METKKGRIFYFDFIRVLAIFLVIFIHVSAIDTTLNIGSTQWEITKILNYFAHASVPLFFMISGALLLNSKKTISLSYTWKKRIPRVVIPFVAWSLLATYIGGLYSHSFDMTIISKMYANFLNSPVSPTLWFMYPLIGLYILSPALRALVENTSTKIIVYIIAIWLVTNSLMPSLSNLLPKAYSRSLSFYPGAQFTLMGGYVGYFILGYLVSKLDVKKFNTWLLLLVMLLSGFAGNDFSLQYPKGDGIWNEDYVASIFILIMSFCAYILLQKWGQRIKSKHVQSVFSFFSPLVFGVYLVHNLIILFVEPYFLNTLHINGLGGTFLRYIIVAVSATIIIWILSWIPGINYILTGTTRRKNK